MKTNPKNPFARLILSTIAAPFTAALFILFAPPGAQAAALTWSGSDGDWQDTAVGGWSAAWSNATPDSGTFNGAGGTVSVLGLIITAGGTAPLTGGLIFAGSGNYTLSASSAQSVTVGTTTNILVSIASGRTVIIGGNVTLTRPLWPVGGIYPAGEPWKLARVARSAMHRPVVTKSPMEPPCASMVAQSVLEEVSPLGSWRSPPGLALPAI